jgi:hypothetical protein
MKQEELVKGLKVLGIAYSKEFTQEECVTYYEFLQEYTYDTFKAAVKNIIKKSKFLPKISELVEECENCKEQVKFEVIEFMNRKGYFKNIKEYEKTITWYSKGLTPDWLMKDMQKYYKMMQQEKLSYNEQLMIGG